MQTTSLPFAAPPGTRLLVLGLCLALNVCAALSEVMNDLQLL